MNPAAGAKPTVFLRDYRAPAWRVVDVELEFDLDPAATTVAARLRVVPDPEQPGAPLHLDGEGLELLELRVDGHAIGDDQYDVDARGLTIRNLKGAATIQTRTLIVPERNTALQGLYLSGQRDTGFLLTQCEAEGFRRITWFVDRPDVLARYTATLRASKARFPLLLANGNAVGSGDLSDGRHWARFVDPHPKPSYLFAVVAGRLQSIERDYVTADGRAVTLKIWSEADVIDRCDYAMNALERSMRWDEQTYGRNYDLDVFHVVATHDFNMGAMENKGLNIFNAKYLLADPDSSTDDEYRHVESVIAHEYFHNWSGNRVTCRDWFQLSLKEGLTVFREQSFSADMNSASLKRIEDVSLLRRAQFPEDAGPLAHPVRPAQYSEINNFYTATVYEKGAELVRMLAGRLGPEGFRRGMDLYFARNDGRAATLEDFLGALGEANHTDLSPYLAWYGQAGTPRLHARGEYDKAGRSYALTLRQHTPTTSGQPRKHPLPIPVKLALFDGDGRLMDLHMDGQTSKPETECVVVLSTEEQTFTFQDVPSAPVPSLLRGFSAPVILEYAYDAVELALLLRHDPDGFNRWEASQQLATLAYAELRDGGASHALEAWLDALSALFAHNDVEPALMANLLTPPGEVEWAEREASVDPARIHALRQQLQRHLADRIGAEALHRRYLALVAETSAALDATSQAGRRLKQRVLELLCLIDVGVAQPLAAAQYENALGMTDRLGALTVLLRSDAVQAPAALAHYRQRYADNALALDKWFMAQAQVPGETALERVLMLERDASFTLKNPNRVQSLLGAFVRANPSGFHRANGAGYRFLAERLVQLDALNPQVAARLATAFNGWQRLEPGRREAARMVIEDLADREGLSRNLREIVANVRKQ